MAEVDPKEEQKLEELRKKLAEKMSKNSGGFERDPNELRIPSNLNGEFQVTFVVLPGLEIGEKYTKIIGGGRLMVEDVKPEQAMDGDFYYPNGKHWFGRGQRPLECPRVQFGSYCPLCQFGFDLMEGQPKEVKSRIAKKYLASGRWAVNVYVLNDPMNPEEYRDRVMWYNAPKTIQDKFTDCINRTDEGDDQYEKQPYGIFFHPSSCYIFKLKVKAKGGFPDYSESKFLTGGGKMKLSSILNNKKTKSKYSVDQLLDMRFSLKDLFEAPDIDALQEKVSQFKTGISEDIEYNVIDSPVEAPKPNKTKATKATTKAAKAVEKVNKVEENTVVYDDELDEESEINDQIDKLLGGESLG